MSVTRCGHRSSDWRRPFIRDGVKTQWWKHKDTKFLLESEITSSDFNPFVICHFNCYTPTTNYPFLIQINFKMMLTFSSHHMYLLFKALRKQPALFIKWSLCSYQEKIAACATILKYERDSNYDTYGFRGGIQLLCLMGCFY